MVLRPRSIGARLSDLQVQQRRAEDDGDHQHLQQFALGEGRDEVVREDVQDEVHRRVRLSCRHGRLHAGCGGGGRDALADPEEIPGKQAKRERQRRDDLEVEHRHQADLADALEVTGRDDADRHAQEDQWCYRRLDQAQEDVAQDLEVGRKGREYESDGGAEDHGDDDLKAEVLPERLLRASPRRCLRAGGMGCCSHRFLLRRWIADMLFSPGGLAPVGSVFRFEEGSEGAVPGVGFRSAWGR